MNKFQSTLPHGSDDNSNNMNIHINNFNPRSLTGATRWYSILNIGYLLFQSTLPHGSDRELILSISEAVISIHAPSRERRCQDGAGRRIAVHFNPRSLTGATYCC